MSKNRYKFTFGKKSLTLTTDKDNLYMEEVERIAKEKYQAIKKRMKPNTDDETLAIVLAVNCISLQLGREKEFTKLQEEVLQLRQQLELDSSDQTTLFEEE